MLRRKEVYRLYRRAGLGTKVYLRIKLRICPFLQMETYFPSEGKVIDLGCGNGVFSNLLKLASPSRDIVGFDLDPKKVLAAREVHKNISGLEFRAGNIINLDFHQADVFSLIDVLYLIPFAQQEEMLRKCHRSLSSGGTLILKDMDTKPRWKSRWNLFQETLAVKITGFTLGGKFYFRDRAEYVELLENIGFKVTAVPLDKGTWYPHILYICVKG
jgi:SAM-dependent methyltransferase